jgi:GDPmannose 4,6-dehydratase
MSFRNKRVLITGISGFAGSYLANHLVKQGADVYGFYRRRADGILPHHLRYCRIQRNVTLCEGDLLDLRSVASAVEQSNPDYIFHMGAQSFVQRSFACPTETMNVNCQGTGYLLDAVKCRDIDPVIVYAGSSEEYGLVIYSQKQYKNLKEKYGVVFPAPVKIPELPVGEENPLRPMSPYAVSKVYGDHLMRNYHTGFGLRTIVSRGFNHEGAGRGSMFVTASITRQVTQLMRGEIRKIVIGNVNAFRDWSHVNDIVNGYCLLATMGQYGDVYNQGSGRTNSVLTYLLLSLESAGYKVEKIQAVRGHKVVKNPTDKDKRRMFGLSFEKTAIDRMLLEGDIEFTAADQGLTAFTCKGKVSIEFDSGCFRPSEVPILLASTSKIAGLGFKTVYSLQDIIEDQLNYYRDKTL